MHTVIASNILGYCRSPTGGQISKMAPVNGQLRKAVVTPFRTSGSSHLLLIYMAGLLQEQPKKKKKLYGRLPHFKCQLIHSFQAYIIKFVLLSQLVIISQAASASLLSRCLIRSGKSRGGPDMTDGTPKNASYFLSEQMGVSR